MKWFIVVTIMIAIVLNVPSTVIAQRDAPVWNCYLSPISISDDHPNMEVRFVLHKDGGPHEHFEHQCYLLVYLKENEDVIRQRVQDSHFIDKANQERQSFLKKLEQQKLIARVGTQVAKNIPDDQRESCGCISGKCFRYKFTINVSQLFEKLDVNLGFDPAQSKVSGNSTWFDQRLGMIVFVPTNDSPLANEVARELQQTHDFAHLMDWDTSILYFKPLPYEFQYRRIKGKLVLSIN